MTQFFSPLMLVLCGAVLGTPARADMHALLVGVGDYQYLDADLQGPGYDVGLMAQTLVARGMAPGQITALTTMPDAPDLPAGVVLGQPTKAAIMAAMQGLSAKAKPDDTVVFYFSGHGSQSPDTSGDEQGGADEILLPMDAAGWKGAIAAVENALLDDELNAWAAGLTAAGVKLIGVIDACHSGTGFRSTAGAGHARVLPPEVLGVPDDLPAAAPHPVPELGGAFAFLYSSQSDQRSFEYPLGEGQAQRWHGAFTLALTQVLREAPGASWGQVLAAARDRMTQGSARQEPDGEGPLLDAPVFGTGSGTSRFALRAGQVQAGLLQGLTVGSTLALYDSPAGGAALASARITKLTAGTAELDAPALPEAAAWAEMQSPAPPPPLHLAPVTRAEASDAQDYTAIEAALTTLRDEGLVVLNAPTPDLVPIFTAGTLALAGLDGVLDPQGQGATPRAVMRAGEDMTAAAMRLLENAAHATRMRAVLAGLGAGRGLSVGGPPLAVEFERKAGAQTADGCARAGKASPNDPAQGVHGCDELWLTVTNRSGRVQDVTVFYLAQDFTLTPLWPRRNLSNRLALGESARIGMRIEASDPMSFAAEEILIVALSPEVDEPRADLSALATPDRLRAMGAEGHALSLIAGLMTPEDGTQTRGFTLKRPELTLLRQPVLVRPNASLSAPP
ncbi:caspase family protein [Pseudorhodobacter sp. E13]|uniref:caspase family protein n=1 Tax=Pseudorhodobacter sp. E13 TaxID=2487931 RepID=UPI001315A803|nr:caspase family protein [Pseudorhodobacter sp. E13]